MPYSCQLQFGTSGSWVIPVGGARTCRGIAREISHTSTLTIVHTIMRSPFGNRSFGRSTIAEYFARSFGNAIPHTTLLGRFAHKFPLLPTRNSIKFCTRLLRSLSNVRSCWGILGAEINRGLGSESPKVRLNCD